MIIKTNDLDLIRKKYSTKKIVLLKGSFDLLHAGHIYMMEQAKKYGDILVVIVKPNIAIKNKGYDRPIIDEKDRILQVDSIKYVDYTILANQEIGKFAYQDIEDLQTKRNYEIVKKLKPNVLVHPKGHKNPNALEYLYKELGTEIIEIERDTNKLSTTEIINKIRDYKSNRKPIK